MKNISLIIILIFFSYLSYSQDTIEGATYTVYKYSNGQVSSEGYIQDNKPNHYWKTYWENSYLKSEGNRVNFELEGPWIFYNNDGSILLEIEYKQGKKDGKKTSYSEDLVTIENYKNDVKDGWTKIYRKEDKSLKKETFYIDGKESGYSKEFAKDGRLVYLVQYKNGFIISRERINRYNKNGNKHGFWKEYYANNIVKNECYYYNGKKHGYLKNYDKEGNLVDIFKYEADSLMPLPPELQELKTVKNYYPDGSLKILGTYKYDGTPHGLRKEYDSEGNIVQSYIFSDGVVISEGVMDDMGNKQGKWKEYYYNGALKAEGEYLNNKRKGKWKFYHDNGIIEELGQYNSNGRNTGKWIWYYESGNLRMELYYRNGRIDGEYLEYDDSDSTIIIVEGEYVNNFEEGEWIYNINGVKRIGEYSYGVETGIWKIYYENGILGFEGNYQEGEENGEHIFYYPNGNIQEKGNFLLGYKEGEWKSYNEDGSLYITVEYKAGIEIKINGSEITPVIEIEYE